MFHILRQNVKQINSASKKKLLFYGCQLTSIFKKYIFKYFLPDKDVQQLSRIGHCNLMGHYFKNRFL